MTRQRRLEAFYSAQRAAEVNWQLKQYLDERQRMRNQIGGNDVETARRRHQRPLIRPAAVPRDLRPLR